MKTSAIVIIILAAGTLYGQPGSTKRVDITDQVLNMKAFSYTIPSNWNFEGGVIPGSSCATGSTPFWRASSPDGLSGVKFLPRADWGWSTRPMPGMPPTPDCLPFKQVMKARDFLTYMLPVLQVQFVREENEPEAEKFQAQLAGFTRQQYPTVWSGDRARFAVKYEINGHPVEELLVGMVMCSDSPVAYVQPPIHTNSCSAFLWRAHAPAGNLAAAATVLDSITGSMITSQEWSQRWSALMIQAVNERAAEQTARSLAQGDQLNRFLASRRKAFDQAQAMRSHQHQDFMASMQRGADLNKARFQDQQYAKRQNAEDWCDYALDCTRSYDNRLRVGNCMSRQTAPR